MAGWAETNSGCRSEALTADSQLDRGKLGGAVHVPWRGEGLLNVCAPSRRTKQCGDVSYRKVAMKPHKTRNNVQIYGTPDQFRVHIALP